MSMREATWKVIAHIETEFPAKFGIPRQSGLVETLTGRIIFEPEFRQPEAVRGLEGFSHIWILWQFSKAGRENWSATVAPPRLGGKKKVGVFASRSPFRPNPIGLSSVKLERIEMDEKLGPVLYVSGADLLNGTPIYDIKPYLAFTDSHPDAVDGFAGDVFEYGLEVEFPEELLARIPEEQHRTVIELLKQDPRPGTQEAVDKEYRMLFGEQDIWFHVKDRVLTVHNVVEKPILDIKKRPDI